MAAEDPGPSILIDASALIALLGGEPAAPEVRDILAAGGAGITTLDLAESVDRLQRRYGLASARTRPVIEGLLDEALTLLPLRRRRSLARGRDPRRPLPPQPLPAARCPSPTPC